MKDINISEKDLKVSLEETPFVNSIERIMGLDALNYALNLAKT